MAFQFTVSLIRRARHLTRTVGNLALLDVYGRVARWLRELADRDGEESPEGVVIRQRPTHQEIAGLIGTSRETVSRALSELAHRGHIDVSGKRILLRRSFLVEAERRGQATPRPR